MDYLAKKSKKLAKEVYAMAATPDRPPNMNAQQFQPSQGLSQYHFQQGASGYAPRPASPLPQAQSQQTSIGAVHPHSHRGSATLQPQQTYTQWTSPPAPMPFPPPLQRPISPIAMPAMPSSQPFSPPQSAPPQIFSSNQMARQNQQFPSRPSLAEVHSYPGAVPNMMLDTYHRQACFPPTSSNNHSSISLHDVSAPTSCASQEPEPITSNQPSFGSESSQCSLFVPNAWQPSEEQRARQPVMENETTTIGPSNPTSQLSYLSPNFSNQHTSMEFARNSSLYPSPVSPPIGDESQASVGSSVSHYSFSPPSAQMNTGTSQSLIGPSVPGPDWPYQMQPMLAAVNAIDHSLARSRFTTPVSSPSFNQPIPANCLSQLSTASPRPTDNNQLTPFNNGTMVLSPDPRATTTAAFIAAQMPLNNRVSPLESTQFTEQAYVPATLPKALTTVNPRDARALHFDISAPSAIRVQRDGDAPNTRKILSLDGGGVRGLSSLMILDHLMDRLKKQRGVRLEPWEEFDMIAGTSTGGLIAIMLGRLKMSVAECKKAYATLSQSIFTPANHKVNVAGRAVKFLKAEGRFDSEPLENCIKKMLTDHQLSDSELLKDQDPDAPKVFVCAVQGRNGDTVVIRSYENNEYDDLYDICKIWEAARATAAASTFFDPIKIGNRSYVDGALKHNNPIDKIDDESRELWPCDDRLIISIGTGSAPGPAVTGGGILNLAQALAKIVTDSEDKNNAFRRRNMKMIDNNRLFRFNVYHGLADVPLEEYKAIEDIESYTGTYLKWPDTSREVDKCAVILKATGQRLGYIAGEELLRHQKIQKLSKVCCEFCEKCCKGISYNNAMFFCMECQMIICSECHSSHDSTHMRKLLRFRLMQWMEKLPGVEELASCHHCAKESKIRYECQTCATALCRSCAGYADRRQNFFNEHQQDHPNDRAFTATYPPFWATTQKWVQEQCPCLTIQPAAVAHCDRCHQVLTISTRFFWCRTCTAEFGSSQHLCGTCYSQEDITHRSKHEFYITDIVFDANAGESIEEIANNNWRCSACPGQEIDEGSEHLHPHPHLQIAWSPFMIEVCRIWNYRTCYKNRTKNHIEQRPDPTTLNCSLCDEFLSYEQPASVCLSSECTWIFCAPCTETRRCGHRHRLYEMVVKRPPAAEFSMLSCDQCSEVYSACVFQGLRCGDCNNFDVCLQCVFKVTEGSLELPEGLPHMKILKPCKTRKWQWYRLEETEGSETP